ncbi:MAG TPA: hypothetical protein VNO30_25555 [Kofleriaceae bacterium]|nr:hypothetical protein [Kofleriaceae bacterium]
MRYRDLRRILQQIVIAGLPATTAGCVEAVIDTDCIDTVDRTFHLETPADPPLELKINRCRVDVDACNDLCAETLERNNILHTPTSCTVDFMGEANLDVNVSYETSSGEDGCPIEGRRPAGLVEPGRPAAQSAAGAWLARAAWLEAASIHAFVRLAGELEQHGAPPALVRWALLSAREEVRHAAAMARLAACYGGRPPVPEVAPQAPRSLEALAIENAVEGCVRETWGAVLAEWQARAAGDPRVRATFAAIARDEARHAALAWAIDRWARTQLDAVSCARVDAAHQAAATELASATDLSSAVLGLPDGPQARGLYARALDSIFSRNGGRTCHA